MSTTFTSTVSVPADVETTWQALTGPTWPQAQDAHLHDGSVLVSSDATPDGGAVITVSRRLPDKIPGFLQRFTPKDGRISQTDAWGPAVDGVRRGTWSASFPGSPAEIRGEMSIEPVPAGSRWTVLGSVQVKVPLVGGRIEAFVAPLLGKLVDKQGEVLRELLSAPPDQPRTGI